jgi:hypothetical protein
MVKCGQWNLFFHLSLVVVVVFVGIIREFNYQTVDTRTKKMEIIYCLTGEFVCLFVYCVHRDGRDSQSGVVSLRRHPLVQWTICRRLRHRLAFRIQNRIHLTQDATTATCCWKVAPLSPAPRVAAAAALWAVRRRPFIHTTPTRAAGSDSTRQPDHQLHRRELEEF